MNEILIRKIQETTKTIYTISKETGIPYSTLHELVKGKTHINKCAAETVLTLSLYLNCDMKELLDPIPLIANMCGKYMGIKYKWIYSQKNNMELHIWYKKKEIIIDSGGLFNQPRFYTAFQMMTEMLIENFLESTESERMLYD